MNYVDPIIESDAFVWNGVFGVCDLTDLPGNLSTTLGSRFNVRSSKTGKVIHFFSLVNLYDAEGELTGWRYRSEGGEFTIDIIND